MHRNRKSALDKLLDLAKRQKKFKNEYLDFLAYCLELILRYLLICGGHEPLLVQALHFIGKHTA